jgi:hypothetical protein
MRNFYPVSMRTLTPSVENGATGHSTLASFLCYTVFTVPLIRATTESGFGR